MPPEEVSFGAFEFDERTGELRRDGKTVRLEPQPAKVLALLVARAGELVSRDEIRQSVWGDDVHVDVDRGLAYALNQVRTALGDTADAPRYIETLPRRGVRFIAPVERADAGAAVTTGPPPSGSRRAGWLLVAAAFVAVWLAIAQPWAGPEPLIVAVSVFDNETGRPEHDAFTARLSDTVVTRLVATDPARLGVIGNDAILRSPRDRRDLDAIRRETGAAFVVLGQLQPDPGGLRVIAHLIKLDDGTHVWAERFVRPAAELGGLERIVAEAVADAVGVQLAGS